MFIYRFLIWAEFIDVVRDFNITRSVWSATMSILNWSLQPLSQDYNLASCISYVVYVNFIDNWWDPCSKVHSEWQILETLSMEMVFTEDFHSLPLPFSCVVYNSKRFFDRDSLAGIAPVNIAMLHARWFVLNSWNYLLWNYLLGRGSS